ncbi:MAG TPA: hypothetical protein VN864_08095 [Thermoplasmata archaeon]|nr:hypothetical protein [Thermoplasmata archaeon]
MVGHFGLVEIAAILALVVLAPLAASHAVTPTGKHVPPFSGSSLLGHRVSTTGCGGAASFVRTPAFNLTTGVGITFGKSSATGCGPPGFPDDGATEGTTGMSSANFTPVGAGPWKITLNFTVSYAYNLTETGSSASRAAISYGVAQLFLDSSAWDETTSTAYGTPSQNLLFSATTNGSASGVVSGHHSQSYLTISVVSNFTAGDHYIFLLYVVASELAHVDGGTSATASALLNLATNGHHFKFNYWSFP